MDREKILKDLRASIKIMEANILLFKNGTEEVYPVIASELRKLICDKNINKDDAQDNSLLRKIYTSILLHRLKQPKTENNKQGGKLILKLYGSLKFDGKGGYKVINLFDGALPKLELKDWLKQELFFAKRKITIADFIKSIADKEGAHSDAFYNDTLLLIGGIKVNTESVKAHYIVALGEYIFSQTKMNTAGVL